VSQPGSVALRSCEPAREGIPWRGSADSTRRRPVQDSVRSPAVIPSSRSPRWMSWSPSAASRAVTSPTSLRRPAWVCERESSPSSGASLRSSRILDQDLAAGRGSKSHQNMKPSFDTNLTPTREGYSVESGRDARLSTRVMVSDRPPRLLDEGVSCGCQAGPKSSRKNRATLKRPAARPGQESAKAQLPERGSRFGSIASSDWRPSPGRSGPSCSGHPARAERA
jgi:hypothetical protein